MMRIRGVLTALVIAAATLTGCDQAGNIAAPAEEVVGQDGGGDLTSDRWALARARFAQRGEYKVVLIGRDGGSLQVGNHYLEVRAGAVTSPTYFVMQLRDGENIVSDLHAYRSSTGQVVSTFPAGKVFLYLKYSDAVVDPGASIAVGYIPDEQSAGAIVPMQSFVYPQHSVVGSNLTHFSTYALIVD